MEVAAKFEMAAAIDFGTTYSGYGYSYRYDKDKIHVNSNWSSGSALWKVPTAILFDDQLKFMAFGEDAENKYSEFAESDEEHKYYYFHRFKMMLYSEQNVTRDLHLVAANGKTMKAIDVFSGAISYLKSHLMNSVNDRNSGNRITVDKIRWVLTVPAIWSDGAKQFMREAAVKCGIPTDALSIALEPECASLYTQSLKDAQTVDFAKAGTKYMVLDNGGGTIDVTVHQIVGGGGVKELYKATGGAWGGTKVDILFEEYLTTMFSKRVIDKVKKDFPSDWVDMMRDFEKIKRSINRENANDFVLFFLKPSVREVYQDLIGVNLVEAFRNNISSRGASMRGSSRLQIPRRNITEMIENVSKTVKGHASFLLQQPEVRGLDFINMVGGFSNSKILVDQIKSLVGRIPVIVPEEAELAVVKGAVIFGWKPNYITSRRSKKTYGISMVSDYKASVDPLRLKFMDDDGVVKCKMIFDRLVSVNQDIGVGQKVSRNYFPVYNNQSEMNIVLYASDNGNVRYCDEEGVIKVGCLVVPMPDAKGNKNRKVAVDVQFGNTEFRVDGRDLTSGKIVNASYDFLLNY